MTIQQNDCYIHMKARRRILQLEVGGAGFRSPLRGIGLIRGMGVRKVLHTVLADLGILAEMALKSLIEGHACGHKGTTHDHHDEMCFHALFSLTHNKKIE
jgi:hypothetical protein